MKMYQPVVTRSGWTEWQAPQSKYKLGCCDCGLIHDFEFKVIKVKSGGKYIKGKVQNYRKYRVLMRAKRNEKLTRSGRKKKQMTIEKLTHGDGG